MFVNGFHLFVYLDPEAFPLFRIDLAEAVYAAAAGAVDRLFGAARLVAEKTAGIKGAVAAHGTAIKRSFRYEFQQPQEAVPEFTGLAEPAETACQAKERSLWNIHQPVNKVAERILGGREMLQGYSCWFLAVKAVFGIFLEIVESGYCFRREI